MEDHDTPFAEAEKSLAEKKRWIPKGIALILLGALCVALGVYLLRFC